MSIFEFPTQDDINRIYSTAPFQSFRDMNKRIFALLDKDESAGEFDVMFKNIETREFLFELHYRLSDIAKSYVLTSYFFEKGIPDEKWFLSPGREGSSIEYFPHFERLHFEIKDWFDYFSDTFYHTFFSALDMVGHLLNIQYGLEIEEEKVSFNRALHELSKKGKPFDTIFEGLAEIRNDPIFSEARRLRNDITHNHLPSSTGLSVTREEGNGWKGIKLGNRNYTPSATIMNNVQKVIGLLERVVILVTE